MDDPVMMRAWRVCLDPTSQQRSALAQNAGAARWAFNYALGRKVAAHNTYRTALAEALGGINGPTPALQKAAAASARETAGKIPTAIDNLAAWRMERGDDRDQIPGVSPWWRAASSYSFSSAMRDADAAFKAWLDSLAGRRAGKPVGYPRFKKKGRSRDSFRIHHDVKKPTIRVDDARHLIIPTIGRVRLHSNLRRLIRLQTREQVTIQSVTISREADRWYASILTAHPAHAASPTRRQTAAGTVGVDLGVKTAATLSDGTVITNPRHSRKAAQRLTKASRAYARTQKGSANRAKAAARLARIQARTAAQRQGWLHQVTKQLAASWADIVIEDLNVAGMTRSAHGTNDNPGRKVRQKAGLNRAILDVAFGEFRRQLEYKTIWYGSTLHIASRWMPSSKTCSGCGWINPNLTLADRQFSCQACGLNIDRDLNAAINLAHLDTTARTTPPAEPGQAVGQPDTCDTRDPEATNRVPSELQRATARRSVDVGRPHPRVGPPRQSNPPALSQRAAALANYN